MELMTPRCKTRSWVPKLVVGAVDVDAGVGGKLDRWKMLKLAKMKQVVKLKALKKFKKFELLRFQSHVEAMVR